MKTYTPYTFNDRYISVVSSSLTHQNKENHFFRFFDHFTYFPQYLSF